MNKKLSTSIKKVERSVESHDYKGYEPFDGLSSYLRKITLNTLIGDRLLQQLIRQSPFNLRPILGVPKLDSTKGRGYMAAGYMNMLKVTGLNDYRAKIFAMLDWLDKNKSPFYSNHSWGNHFDYASRAGWINKNESTIVWTSIIGQVYMDGYEQFHDDRHLEIIKSIRKWILELPRENTKNSICLSYVVKEQSSIHNSNMLGAAFLARSSKIIEDSEGMDVAQKAMKYSCDDQLHNGAWYYGKNSKYHWIDNFHTGYNLVSLKCYLDNSGDSSFQKNLSKGYAFFKDHFIEATGCPKYYYNRVFPIDIQCASQAIDTLCYFNELDKDALSLAAKVANWTIDKMQAKDGHFYYRLYPFKIRAKIPMIHWGQATMYKALTSLLRKIQEKSKI